MIKIKYIGGLIFTVTFLLGQAIAQSQPSNQSPRKYKMTTTIPAGIEIPNTVKTSLGSFEFFDGVPNQASTQKLYDILDLQRAVQAYLLALPVVNQASNRNNILKLGPANLTVPIWENLVDSTTIELTANDNTPYTWFWVDLSNGPVVIEVPPKVLGLVNDIWYHWNGDIGITGPDKGKGGKYILLPPGYNKTPSGYFVIRPGSKSVWAAWRSFLVNGNPKPGVDETKKYMKIYPLSQAGNPPKLKFINMSGRPFNMVAPTNYQFWELLNQVVQTEPTNTVDATTLGFWASVGILKGKPFTPDARMKKLLIDATKIGDAISRVNAYRMRQTSAYFFKDRRWMRPFIGSYKFQWQPGVANLDAAAMFFTVATGVTPAMDTQSVGEGSTYPWTAVDENNLPLDGGKNYHLHLPPNIPVKTFWSVIVYDTQTRSMLQTDQQYPSVSSQNKDLQINPDGSVDVYFGPTLPPGKKGNWIQTIPGKGWFTILRLYGPLQPWFDKTWRPDDIKLVK
ncbi:DUF1254 domain-containing protein [Legionella bononiensis]|uniref:DUF1254 domain-containing protein n=1 Tax=Legionella bononiensis TaxID=2793102 RepID=A0ABS1WAS2_9GAMM|nr:DUF1254 domain-containing protein [Legionella bononiensis]MBL7480330.1 DUF1254 domain-containing protein [Legionella bononiensis]MBL7526438.1 DUF1254 domain-containing protein [Legionella bononiensis]MBL7563068.1 DUF1254 domain-containing protein [Legionella bononiensis]